MKNDAALYPVLRRLDARPDLALDQRQQVQTLWADWAVRRAAEDMDNGRPELGVEILQAASQDFPDNLNVRFAVAGASMRIGRVQDALALYKAIPMTDAGSSDFQGAIGAALTARDMAQAEVWLRVALNRFPNDPSILGLAAQFERARGNNKRATEFWRAALAAAPPVTSTATLVTGISATPGATPAPALGDTRRLLDPHPNPASSPSELAPLPSFKTQPSSPAAIAMPPPQAAPAQNLTSPSNNPLPLPSTSFNSSYAPSGQGTNAPVYVPQAASNNTAPSGPVMVDQSATPQVLTQSNSGASASRELPPSTQLTGRVNLSSSPANSNSIGNPEAESAELQPSNGAEPSSPPPTNPRIASEPMNTAIAQTKSRLSDETDSQLTQGSATHIHTVPNSPSTVQPAAEPSASRDLGVYDDAQYTPSAQDAATGAFSAPQQQQPASQQPSPQQQPAPQPSASAPAKPKAGSPTAKHRRAKKPAPQPAEQPTQTLGNAPIGNAPTAGETAPPVQPQPSTGAQEENPAETTNGTGVSDQELEQRSLPPLRGPWVRVQRQANPISPREEAEEQLHAIESGYSGWLGGTSMVNYRSGNPGYSQLTAIESPFEASAPLGYHARIAAIARPVFLDSAQANGTANISVQESQSGVTCLVTIPEPIGTYAASQSLTPCTAPTIGVLAPPAQQNSVGLGGELQLTFPHFAIAGGYTPAEFLSIYLYCAFQVVAWDRPLHLQLCTRL